MAVSNDSIQSICDSITREVEQLYSGLSLFFIVHGTGKLREAIALAEHAIISHPAGRAAQAVIRKHNKGERSSFLGLAIASESKMMGLKKQDHLLGLFNVNQNDFDNEDEVRAQVYHLAWHAIDLYEIRQNPAYKRKFKSGPMVPKRSALNLSKAHLQADAFSATLGFLEKDNDLLSIISKKRALDSISPVSDLKAEDHPSVISMEACNFAITEHSSSNQERTLETARKLSLEIGHAFDEDNIQQWWDFAIPAQDMAWRGYSKEEILGAAVNTSDNPFVRSIGYLVQEITDIEPMAATQLQHSYNAFVDPEVNSKLHREMVDTVFEEAISQGMEEESSRAFLDAANKQNESLTDGRILGWCANALQDAARAFEKAILKGSAPDQAARMHFEGSKEDRASWETLQELGSNIIDQRRQGFAVTMGSIAEICHDHPAFAPILDSLKVTMNDPAYLQKLEASNDLSMRPQMPEPTGLAPKGPAPKGPAPKGLELNGPAPTGPAPQAPPAVGPSLGGKGNAQRLMHQRRLAEQKRKQSKTDGAGDSSQT